MMSKTDRIRPYVVLVGVAAVGKTTLGAAVAPKVGLPFHDNELTMERRCGVTIAELSRKPENDEVIDRLLWETYQELAAAWGDRLFAMVRRFWRRWEGAHC